MKSGEYFRCSVIYLGSIFFRPTGKGMGMGKGGKRKPNSVLLSEYSVSFDHYVVSTSLVEMEGLELV